MDTTRTVCNYCLSNKAIRAGSGYLLGQDREISPRGAIEIEGCRSESGKSKVIGCYDARPFVILRKWDYATDSSADTSAAS